MSPHMPHERKCLVNRPQPLWLINGNNVCTQTHFTERSLENGLVLSWDSFTLLYTLHRHTCIISACHGSLLQSLILYQHRWLEFTAVDFSSWSWEIYIPNTMLLFLRLESSGRAADFLTIFTPHCQSAMCLWGDYGKEVIQHDILRFN